MNVAMVFICVWMWMFNFIYLGLLLKRYKIKREAKKRKQLMIDTGNYFVNGGDWDRMGELISCAIKEEGWNMIKRWFYRKFVYSRVRKLVEGEVSTMSYNLAYHIDCQLSATTDPSSYFAPQIDAKDVELAIKVLDGAKTYLIAMNKKDRV